MISALHACLPQRVRQFSLLPSGSNRLCLYREILNSICQLCLHRLHKDVPEGQDLFRCISVWFRPKEKWLCTLLNVNAITLMSSPFWHCIVLYMYSQWASGISDLWPPWKVNRKVNQLAVFSNKNWRIKLSYVQTLYTVALFLIIFFYLIWCILCMLFITLF